MNIFRKIKNGDKRIVYCGHVAIMEYCPKKYLKLFPEDEEKILLDEIFRIIGKRHDSVIYLRAGLGEAYIFYFMLQDYIKKNKFKNPCIICHRKFYNELSQMFASDIPFYHVDIPQNKLNQTLRKRNIKYRGIAFNVNPSTLPEILVVWENYRAKTENRHYIDVLKELNSIPTLTPKLPIISEETKQTALNKVKDLNINNFVFLIPEANFFHLLNDAIWKNIKNNLKQKGYDVLVNTPELTLSEAYYLATLSKSIIGIRGGLSEVLSTVNVSKHIIYTRNKARVLNSLQIFTLKEYPLVNKETVFEYECFNEDPTEVINNILSNF
ncbi:hypothetical protein J6R97_05520 [bacterium]|nr:hypothetical protein [bacterium]